jgi:hypothetical protein
MAGLSQTGGFEPDGRDSPGESTVEMNGRLVGMPLRGIHQSNNVLLRTIAVPKTPHLGNEEKIVAHKRFPLAE